MKARKGVKPKALAMQIINKVASFNLFPNTFIFEQRLRDQIFVHKLGASPIPVNSNFGNVCLWWAKVGKIHANTVYDMKNTYSLHWMAQS